MIRVLGVSKTYGHKVALSSIDLELGPGIYALLGPNGSGKTTLIRCLAGVVKPTSGTIERSEPIGYLPQKFGMYKQLTVYEAMKYLATLKRVPAHTHEAAIHSALECVRLADKAGDKLKTLSGGMVRRFGIAQTLLGQPSLILLDEPTAGLDPEERSAFKSMVRDLSRDRTLLISTHIVEDVEESCEQIILLKEGVIVANASADTLRAKTSGKVYLVSSADQNKLREPYYVIRKASTDKEETLRILSTAPQDGALLDPTLEDAYMLYLHCDKSS